MNYLKTLQRPRAYPTEPMFWESLLVVCVTLFAIIAASLILKNEVLSLTHHANSDSVTITVLDTDAQ